MSRVFDFIKNRSFIIAIACILVVMVVVITLATKPNKAVTASANEVFEIAQMIRKHYVKKINYWGLSNEQVSQNKMLSTKFYSDNKVVNSLGKPISIGSGVNGDMVLPGGKSFDIVYSDLSKSECIILATYNHQQQEELGLLKITIIGKGEQEFLWTDGKYKLPINKVEAKRICDKSSKVIWNVE